MCCEGQYEIQKGWRGFPCLQTFAELLLERPLPGLSACAFPDMVVMFLWEVTAGTIRRVFLVVFVDSASYRVDSVDMLEYCGVMFSLFV